ncbi:NAD(P)/FAD-dependent oxidoreductase [Terrimonas alba]|uniref:NAD(P)/FAD-dependent oxidoreductase n=1 Tax=Terrimonas alba TaxID=3349636 RepID=UPI0035F2CE1E
MDLHSSQPFWLFRHGNINSYPSLNDDLKTDIAIIGAGISGALVANRLCKDGHKVVVIDRRHAGTGSTAASTALLQYEIDTPLHKLITMVGEKNATRSYALCRKTIDDMGNLCKQLKAPGLFLRKPSFQYASYKKDVPGLEAEFKLRRNANFSIQWLDEKDIIDKFGFAKQAGILSKDGAEADAYKITHAILEKWGRKGLQVYDNTEVIAIRHQKKRVQLTTANNKKITAKKLIIACGYESQKYIPQKVQTLRATYAIASEPFAETNFWHKNALIWETADPYLYIRTTSDNRIIIGGKDVGFSNPHKRDQLLTQKARELEKAFIKLFPSILLKTDVKWAGTFAATEDGLPYIGGIPERPHTYFALGFGGNGITFSLIAADIIADVLLGKKNSDAEIFKFNR